MSKKEDMYFEIIRQMADVIMMNPPPGFNTAMLGVRMLAGRWDEVGSELLKYNNARRVKLPYLQDPNKCPFCGCEDIQGQPTQAAAPKTYTQMYCRTCMKNWNEVLQLVDWEDVS